MKSQTEEEIQTEQEVIIIHMYPKFQEVKAIRK